MRRCGFRSAGRTRRSRSATSWRMSLLIMATEPELDSSSTARIACGRVRCRETVEVEVHVGELLPRRP